MATVREICSGALRLLGTIQPGRAPSATDMDAAKYSLRSMLESWSTQNLTIYSTTTLELDLIPNQDTYTVGPTGDLAVPRPMDFDYCYLRFQAGGGVPVDQPIAIINDAQRAAITAKTIQSPIPTTVFYNATYPDATLVFWPVPSAAYKAILWTTAPLQTFTNLSDELSFPPGYEQALRYNLAINLAPEYNITVKPEIAKVASESLATLKITNVTPRYLRCDDWTRNGVARIGPSIILEMSRA